MFIERWQGLECGEVLQDGSKLLTASNKCITSELNLPRKRRRLLNNSVIIFSDEPEVDEVPTCTISGSPSKTQIMYGTNNVPTAPITAAQRHDRDLVDSDALANSLGLESAPGLHIKFSNSFCNVSESELISLDRTARSDSFPSLEGKIGVCSGVINTEANKPCFDTKGIEEVKEDQSIRDLCISVLKSQGLPVNNCSTSSAFTKVPEVNHDGVFTQTCKLCGYSESTLKMLLCDHCEEAYHLFCLNPRLKLLPTDQWFCHHCLKINSKVLLETSFLKSPSTSWRRGAAKFEMGPIATMLKYPEPHASRVRIGKPFQAEVPDWSDQTPSDDFLGESLELDPAETFPSNVCYSDWFAKSNSLSNWLQCREVHNNDARNCVEGTVCGKWRRAPFSEVQTDDWDCSCAVVWDPAHADCAVPQELETEQVLLHLKYTEQLRSRIGAKTRKA